jgi:hypothetical protein
MTGLPEALDPERDDVNTRQPDQLLVTDDTFKLIQMLSIDMEIPADRLWGYAVEEGLRDTEQFKRRVQAMEDQSNP